MATRRCRNRSNDLIHGGWWWWWWWWWFLWSEDIRQELEYSGIQDVRLKYKQNWISHLERTDNNRLPKYALTYKPRGRRDRGRPRKRWQRVDAGTGQTTESMEEEYDDDDHIIYTRLIILYLLNCITEAVQATEARKLAICTLQWRAVPSCSWFTFFPASLNSLKIVPEATCLKHTSFSARSLLPVLQAKLFDTQVFNGKSVRVTLPRRGTAWQTISP